MIDVDKIRKQFPILRENGSSKPLVYLDNAATTQKPMVVLERLHHFYSYENSNIHRGIYQLAHNATEQYENARKKVASFINAASALEIVFCGGTTEALNMVAHGLRAQLKPEDEVLVTAMEHHANYVPWQVVCEQSGARFRVVPVTKEGVVDMKQFQALVNHNTKLVAITHISNTLGTINPIHQMIEIARKHHALVAIDGAQSAAFDKVDVQELDCDFFTFSGHKVYGPLGIGVLYGKMASLSRLQPYQQGGAMIVKVGEDQTTFKSPPHGLEAGTPPVAAAIGLGTALEFINDIGIHQIKQHCSHTLSYAIDKLSSVQGLKQIGPSKNISNIRSFVMESIHPHDIATILGEEGIAVRAGHHCTQPLMQALGINSTVRVSFSVYNDTKDVDHLVDALQTVRKIMI